MVQNEESQSKRTSRRRWGAFASLTLVTALFVAFVIRQRGADEPVPKPLELPVVTFVQDSRTDGEDALDLVLRADGSIWRGGRRVTNLAKTIEAFAKTAAHETEASASDDPATLGLVFCFYDDVRVFAHPRAPWTSLAEVLGVAMGCGLPSVCVACRTGPSGETVFLRVLPHGNRDLPFRDKALRWRSDIYLAGESLSDAERDRQRILSNRQGSDYVSPWSPVVMLNMADGADVQSVMSRLECYLHTDGSTVEVAGLDRWNPWAMAFLDSIFEIFEER